MLDEVILKFSHIPGRNIIINKKVLSGYKVIANGLLSDVFSILIGNAVKHSTGPLIVNVFLDKTLLDGDYYCRVRIEDNGPGILDEHKESVFTRFQKGAQKNSGRGLGLYLVKTLVEDFHGIVWVEDRISGDRTKGARFVVMLPGVD